MSLALALNNALTGLRVNQQSLSVLSQNIANVNTDGYSRQVVGQSQLNVEGVGNGVIIEDVVRKVDKYLQRSTLTQGSINSKAQTVGDFYQRLQSLLGQPGALNSIDEYMSNFFNALQQLSTTPETTSLRSNAISAGVTLASQLSGLSRGVQDLRFQADRDISDAVSAINTQLDKLSALNTAIATSNGLKQSTAGLLDERDKSLRALSEILDISITYEPSGAVGVVAGSGIALVEGAIRHQLSYSPAQSVDEFIGESSRNPLYVLTFQADGKNDGKPVSLITAGTSATIKSGITGGKIAGLQSLRDDVMPEILDQLDMLASRIRDSMDEIQNNGSGFPPATQLTGVREVSATDAFEWTGAVRIAAIQSDGSPVTAGYTDEIYTGKRPLTLDLSGLDSGTGEGPGKPTIQTIIDEINNHFGAPGYKAEVSSLNNIQLVAGTDILPSGASSVFDFDFDNENISGDNADFFVTNVTVLTDAGTDITSITRTAPTHTLAATDTYYTTSGSGDVLVDAPGLTGVKAGDTIYLTAPSATVNGITQAELTGYFTVQSIVGTSFTVTTTGSANVTGPLSDPGQIKMYAAYDTVLTGSQQRTNDKGRLQVDLSAGLGSSYYDISVDVGVVNKTTGVLTTSTVTYRVPNNEQDLYNRRYDTTAVGVGGTRVIPNTSEASLRAIMVDADGIELPKFNGKYSGASGYLKIEGGAGQTYSVAIDELDSKQLGTPNGSPSIPGTNWGFSHYFGLNNFYETNKLTSTGETIKNSAVNLKVRAALMADSNLISTGALTLQNQPTAGSGKPQYTYLRYSGDNSVVEKMAQLSTTRVQFEPAGGLPTTKISLQSYSSEILGFTASRTVSAQDAAETAQTLYDGFKTKADAISGVNLDEELANTIIYQNAYSATARIVTVVNQMFETIVQMVG